MNGLESILCRWAIGNRLPLAWAIGWAFWSPPQVFIGNYGGPFGPIWDLMSFANNSAFLVGVIATFVSIYLSRKIPWRAIVSWIALYALVYLFGEFRYWTMTIDGDKVVYGWFGVVGTPILFASAVVFATHAFGVSPSRTHP